MTWEALLLSDERDDLSCRDRKCRPLPNQRDPDVAVLGVPDRIPRAASRNGSGQLAPFVQGRLRRELGDGKGVGRQIDARPYLRVSHWPTTTHEGFETIHGYRLFWKSVGDPGPAGTVVALHGGPGATHDYLLPFIDLAPLGYRVVFYDQIGCGRSDLARDPHEYTVDRDVADLEELRRALHLGRIHVIGSSYGGMLAIAYALAHGDHVRSLVSASGLVDVPLTVREMQRLKRELPAPTREILERHEAKGEYQDPEYLAAVQEYYRRHLCRLWPWPEELTYSIEHTSLPKYGTMNGPNEFTIVGTIRDFDITDRLGEIRVPTLVTAGRYDEITPTVARAIHAHISGSEFTVFDESSHVAFWEERDRYLGVVGDFLRRHA
jgi:proline iminopeptidase